MSGKQYKIGTTDELADEGSAIIQEVEGRELAVFCIDDEYYAVLNFCPHQGGPLCEGELQRDVSVKDDGWTWEWSDTRKIITCPWHRWRFDVVSGACVDAKDYSVPTYDVVKDGNDLYVVIE